MGKSEKLAPPEVDCEAMIQTRNGVGIYTLAELKNCLLHGRGEGYRTETEQKTRKGDMKKKRLGYPKGEANVERMLPLHCLLVERRIVIPDQQSRHNKKSTDGRRSTMQGQEQNGTTRPDIINPPSSLSW